jgi:hypothetical protein
MAVRPVEMRGGRIVMVAKKLGVVPLVRPVIGL